MFRKKKPSSDVPWHIRRRFSRVRISKKALAIVAQMDHKWNNLRVDIARTAVHEIAADIRSEIEAKTWDRGYAAGFWDAVYLSEDEGALRALVGMRSRMSGSEDGPTAWQLLLAEGLERVPLFPAPTPPAGACFGGGR